MDLAVLQDRWEACDKGGIALGLRKQNIFQFDSLQIKGKIKASLGNHAFVTETRGTPHKSMLGERMLRVWFKGNGTKMYTTAVTGRQSGGMQKSLRALMHSGRSRKLYELKKLGAVNYFQLVSHIHTNHVLKEYLGVAVPTLDR